MKGSNKWQKLLKKNAPLRQLSHREAEVYCLAGCGYVPKRIAATMGLSVKTVETYIERTRKKMTLKSGADLQYSAVRHDLRDLA